MADNASHSYDPTGMDARLVRAAQSGDGDAFAQLYDRWFDRVYDVVARISRNPETAAEVAQDTFVVVYERLGSLRQPESFGGWLLRAARNRALNRLERDRRSTAMGDDATAVEVDRQATASFGSPAGASPVVAAAEDNEMEQLVWAASAALGERDASILHLHLRHGLDGADLAEELGVSANAANQSMFRMRKRLGDAIRSWTLWHHGTPSCVELAAVLAAAGVASFGRDAVLVIGRHADDCERCDAEREARVAPAALFAGIPVLAAPAGLKEELARSLSAQGIPAAGETAAMPATTMTAIAMAESGGRSGAPVPAEIDAQADGEGSGDRRRRGAWWTVVALFLVVGAVATIMAWPAGESDLVAFAPTSEVTTTSATTTTTTPPETTEMAELAPPPSETTTSSTTQTTSIAPPAPPPPSPAPPALSVAADADRDPGAAVHAGCDPTTFAVVVTWTTTSASHVEVTGPGAPPGIQPKNGSLVICWSDGASYTVTAFGDEGQVSDETSFVPPA